MLSTNRLEGFQTKEERSPTTKGVESRTGLVIKPDHVSTSAETRTMATEAGTHLY